MCTEFTFELNLCGIANLVYLGQHPGMNSDGQLHFQFPRAACCVCHSSGGFRCPLHLESAPVSSLTSVACSGQLAVLWTGAMRVQPESEIRSSSRRREEGRGMHATEDETGTDEAGGDAGDR